MPEYAAPRGTSDVLPTESPRWEYVEAAFRRTCALYAYRELRTPTFEHTELFTRNLGETTDVVSKEMYTFEDRGGRSITLRPEGTAPAVRAYVEHSLGAASPVSKLYYIGRIFRYERPQAGRLREHTQLGVEAIGSIAPELDAEVIALAVQFYKDLGLSEFELKLNSIGCPKCRSDYRGALVEFASGRLAKLCESCAQRYETNPMRMLDCKLPDCRKALKGAPKLPEYLCAGCSQHFVRLQAYLRALGVDFTVDPTLVRGFDYYTKTAFEFVSGKLGAQNATGGGGRYDNLVEEIGGPPTPGIGFGIGLERLMLALDASGVELPARTEITAFLATLGDEARDAAVKLLAQLRRQGIAADMDYTGRSLKAQMKIAGRIGARYAVIVGHDEVRRQTATLRDMRTSEQRAVPFTGLADALTAVKDS